MEKTNAEKQNEYQDRKKMKEGSQYLEKEGKRQRKYCTKTKKLSKKELKERRGELKEKRGAV